MKLLKLEIIYILLNKYIFFNVLIIKFFLENILCVNGVIKKKYFLLLN